MISKTGFTRRAIALCCTLAIVSAAWSQEFPQRPITIVVPYAAGALPDLFSRALGQSISETLKQPVVIENRPGAGEVVAGGLLSRAPADGYTLMITVLPNIVAPSIQQKLPYSGLSDFTVVAELLRVGAVIVAGPNVQAQNLPELVALMKAQPGKLSYGTSGIGSPQHLMLEELGRLTSTRATHVPYKSFQGAITDLVSGRIDFTIAPINMALQYTKEGKLKIIGTMSKDRLSEAPEISTIGEQMKALSEFNGYIGYGIITRKSTPIAIVRRLNTAIAEAQRSSEFASRVNTVGAVEVTKPLTPEEATANLIRDEARWRAVAKQANIQLD